MSQATATAPFRLRGPKVAEEPPPSPTFSSQAPEARTLWNTASEFFTSSAAPGRATCTRGTKRHPRLSTVTAGESGSPAPGTEGSRTTTTAFATPPSRETRSFSGPASSPQGVGTMGSRSSPGTSPRKTIRPARAPAAAEALDAAGGGATGDAAGADGTVGAAAPGAPAGDCGRDGSQAE